MRAYIIGVGPGDPELITVKGLKLIQNCDVLVGWRSVVERFKGFFKEGSKVVELTYRNEVEKLNEAFSSGKDVCVLDHGDPSVSDYQFVEKVKAVANSHGYTVEVVPGVSSVNALMARLGLDLAKVVYLTMHVRASEEELFNELRRLLECKGERSIVLFPPPDGRGVERVAKFLLRELGDAEVWVAERLTYSDEKLVRFKLSELEGYRNSDLVAMVIP
ncbi:MAG: precorrin-6y C5,15-methyltransferase (decarboxylating) subunit CbiE [Thermoprotei archaeon]